LALIELKNITKTYNLTKENTFRALKGVDLIIKKGEFVAIMGPSGSGKTTLMNILGALDTPSTGKYLVDGVDISTYTDDQLADFRNQTIGFVFQQFNLLPRISVLDNVLLPTLYGPIPQKEERAVEMLTKVGLETKLRNKPNQLSGGQVQRVAIARALIMHPQIIMADEPTGNLDTNTAKEVMDILKQLNKEGNTIILITHEPKIAEYANRIIKIQDGLIQT
jgi:putative ABC transport system ATP-binding protein